MLLFAMLFCISTVEDVIRLACRATRCLHLHEAEAVCHMRLAGGVQEQGLMCGQRAQLGGQATARAGDSSASQFFSRHMMRSLFTITSLRTLPACRVDALPASRMDTGVR